MNSPISQRLMAYSLAAGGALAAAPVADAAIQYTDLNPDLTLFPGDSLQLDLDGDATVDFTIRNRLATSSFPNGGYTNRRGYFSVPASNYAFGAVSASVPAIYPVRLAEGILISASAGNLYSNLGMTMGNWQRYHAQWTSSSIPYTVDTSSARGVWPGAGRAFVGVLFDIPLSTGYHFGWVRLSYNGNCRRLKVYDYAYEDGIDVPLHAGEGAPLQMAPQSLGLLDANLVPLANFTTKPKVYAQYFDPIKDPAREKPKKAALGVMVRPDEVLPATTLSLEWKKKLCLYDKAAFKAAQKAGNSAVAHFDANPIPDLDVDLMIDHREDLVAPPGDRIEADYPADPQISPPEIHAITDGRGNLIGTAPLGAEIVVRGQFFGQKPPKVWLEYLARGAVKRKACKVLKPYEFPDRKGSEGTSVMNLDNGESEIRVLLPERVPADWVHGINTHALVIDNGVGVAAMQFGTGALRLLLPRNAP